MSWLPTVFISHGAPTFALEPGRAGRQLAALGRELPRPQAVLVVSAHWITSTPRVSFATSPETIHDFGGFDPALHEMVYPAAGHPRLARRAVEVLHTAGWQAQGDEHRGLDHGAWVPLMHMYPAADVPVFQISLPATLEADSAWAFGQALQPLSSEGVLVIGSGSLTHNLYEFRQHLAHVEPYVAEFSAWVREAAQSGDANRLRRTLSEAPHAQRAHPTPEHFLPLLVSAGAAADLRPSRILDGGIMHGILSMDSFVFGSPVIQ